MLSLLEKAGLCVGPVGFCDCDRSVFPEPSEEEIGTGFLLWSHAEAPAFLCSEPRCLVCVQYLRETCAEAHRASERLCSSWRRVAVWGGRVEMSAHEYLDPHVSLRPTAVGSLELLGCAVEICALLAPGGTAPIIQEWNWRECQGG